MEKNKEASAVKIALYEQGTTLKSWCEERGYCYRTALHALERHAGGRARHPWGPKTRKILADLSKTLGLNLLPR